MFGVMLILSIPCLFVLLRLAHGFEDLKNHPGNWNLKCQTSCALDPLLLPNNILYYHFCYPIGHPSLFILFTPESFR
jgi:hypothetical protein